MTKYVVQMISAYTEEVLDDEVEVFDNEEEAEDYACECGGTFAEGAEVLSYAGYAYIPPEDVEFVVAEIDDEE